MLNITNKDKEFLSNFFAKNCDLKISLVRFPSYEDREKYVKDHLDCPEVFVRREYNGVETYLYIMEDFVKDGHVYQSKEK